MPGDIWHFRAPYRGLGTDRPIWSLSTMFLGLTYSHQMQVSTPVLTLRQISGWYTSIATAAPTYISHCGSYIAFCMFVWPSLMSLVLWFQIKSCPCWSSSWTYLSAAWLTKASLATTAQQVELTVERRLLGDLYLQPKIPAVNRP